MNDIQNDEISIRDIITAFMRRKWTFFFVFLTTILFSFLYSLSLKPQFTVTRTIKVSDSSIYLKTPKAEFQQTQLEILRSSILIERTAKIILEKNDKNTNTNNVNKFSYEERKKNLISLLRNNLNVSVIKNSDLFKLSFKASNKEQATISIDSLIEGYKKINSEKKIRAFSEENNLRPNTSIIYDKIEEIELKLTELHHKKQELSKKFAIDSYETEKEILLKKIIELETILLKLHTDIMLFEDIYQSIIKGDQKIGESETNHKIIAEHAAAVKVENNLKNEIELLRKKSIFLESIRPQFDQIDLQIQSYAELYNSLLFQLDTLLQSNNEPLVTIQVMDSAPPSLPSHSKSQLVLLLGAMLGCILGAGAVFLKELSDNSIKSAEELNNLFEIPLLGCIQLRETTSIKCPVMIHAQIEELITPNDAKAIRTILTLLKRNLPAKQPTTLMFMELGSENYSSLLTIKCALSYVTEGPCLLIDADFQNRTLSKAFNLDEENLGFSSVVSGQITWKERVRSIPASPGLDIIPSGLSSATNAEFSSEKMMREFFTDISKIYNTVVLDAPGSQALDEILALASMMDAVIMIISEGRTQRDEVHHFKNLLMQVNSNLFGIFMKKP